MTDSLIVSLTTYGKRVTSVYRVVDSLLKQQHQPEKIILWLDESEFSLATLPESLTERVSHKFEIRFCPDYRSYKKLVPAIQAFPNSTIITVDDDFEYPSDLISNLRQASQRYPDAVVASRGRVINTSNGQLESYPSWELVELDEPLVANYCAIPIGYAGILYPPGILYSDVTNIEKFQSLAPHADDLWFKAMAMLNNKPTVILPLGMSMKIKTIEGTQDNALYLTHNAGDANTTQMQNILAHYSKLADIVQSPNFYTATYSAMKTVRATKRAFTGKVAAERVMAIRNAALSLEKMDLVIALKLMEVAKAIRPAGPLINQKLKEYRQKLEQK